MGKLKKRIYPSDITINIGKDAPIPECPIPGERFCLSIFVFPFSHCIRSHFLVICFFLCNVAILLFNSWKEIRHDNTVTWLAYWIDPINGKEFKYVFLAASSSLKGQSDKEKYEKARKLKVFQITSCLQIADIN